jgi:hypothetical protein
MSRVPSDVEKKLLVPIWDQYSAAIIKSEGRDIRLEEVGLTNTHESLSVVCLNQSSVMDI